MTDAELLRNKAREFSSKGMTYDAIAKQFNRDGETWNTKARDWSRSDLQRLMAGDFALDAVSVRAATHTESTPRKAHATFDPDGRAKEYELAMFVSAALGFIGVVGLIGGFVLASEASKEAKSLDTVTNTPEIFVASGIVNLFVFLALAIIVDLLRDIARNTAP